MKLKILLILFNLFSIVFFTFFQYYYKPNRQVSSQTSENIKVLKTDFLKFIEKYDYIPEKSNQFSVEKYSNLKLFKSTVVALLANDLDKAFNYAFSIKYELTKIIDTGYSNLEFLCLLPSDILKSHQGIFCYNQNAKYPHHIGAPHPIKDFNSNIIAVEIFRQNSFKFLSVASAHRCSSEITTTCSGETSVCGSKEAYRISDLAHNPDNYFHDFAIYIHDNISESLTFQIHGCGKKSCPFGTDNDIVARFSVGTKDILDNNVTSNHLNRIFKQKLKVIKSNATSRSCNLADEDDYKLCATSNVQGRYINGQKSNPCKKEAKVIKESRFLYIETNFDLRTNSSRKNDINSQLLIDSISEMLLQRN